MRKTLFILLFSFVILLSFQSAQASKTKSITYHDYEWSEIPGTRIINEWDPDPDSLIETFTNEPDFVSTNNGDGVYIPSYTHQSSESFDGHAFYLNSPDDSDWPSSGFSFYVENGSRTAQTVEYDFMFEDESGKGLRMGIIDRLGVNPTLQLYINLSCDGNGAQPYDHVYLKEYSEAHHSDNEMSLGLNLAPVVWHHLILSFENDIVDGFNYTVVIDNVSVNWRDTDKHDLSGALDGRLLVAPEESQDGTDEHGKDFIIDNISAYNSSYSEVDILNAIDDFFGLPADPPEDPDIPIVQVVGPIDYGLLLSFSVIMLIVGAVAKIMNE